MDAITAYLLGWNVAAIICLVVGLALLVFEMFTPGMGVPGLLGICALIAAVVLRADTFANGVITLAIILVLLGAAGFFIYRSFKKGAISRSPIVLHDAINTKSTSLSDKGKQALVGLEGEALTALRPSGNARFGQERMDVVTEGEFIPKGSRVRIERVEGLRILVKPAVAGPKDESPEAVPEEDEA